MATESGPPVGRAQEREDRAEAGILDVLAQRARATSDDRLAADAIGGLLGVVLMSVWRGPAWYFLLAVAAGFLSFGVWGISDRELLERANLAAVRSRALRGIRFLAMLCGLASAVFLMMVVLAKALGRIIS